MPAPRSRAPCILTGHPPALACLTYLAAPRFRAAEPIVRERLSTNTLCSRRGSDCFDTLAGIFRGRIDLGDLSWRPRASPIIQFQRCVSRIGHGVERWARAGKEQERPAETPRAMVSRNRLPSQPPRGLVKSNPGWMRIDASPSALTPTLYSSCANSPRRRTPSKMIMESFLPSLFPPYDPGRSRAEMRHITLSQQ